MALWFPLMVNSNQIGTVEIIRRDEDAGEHGYTYDYKIEQFQQGVTHRAPTTHTGTVTHRYENGALPLLAAVLNDYHGWTLWTRNPPKEGETK